MTISMRNVATAGAIRSLRHGPVSLSPAVVAIVAKEDDAVDVVTTLAESVQAYRGVVPPAASIVGPVPWRQHSRSKAARMA